MISNFPPGATLAGAGAPGGGMAQFPFYPQNMPFVPGLGHQNAQDPRRGSDLLAGAGAGLPGVGPIRHHRRDNRLPIPGAGLGGNSGGGPLPPGMGGYRSAPYGSRRQRSPVGRGLRDLDRRDNPGGRDGRGRYGGGPSVGRPSGSAQGLGLASDAAGPGAEAAIQGRSLKSYNDLDATRDGKVEELDY